MNDVSNLCGTKLGNYRLERLIGRGRMGVVYLARDEALLRPTALKILSWQAKDHDGQNPEAWFLAEARSVARVNHPNVIQIYGVARQGPLCYIAMEYVATGPVDAVVGKNGPLSPIRATEVLSQAAGALQAAHDAGIVHRDVKPENLLIGAEGVAKLGDFGMALHISKPRPNEPARAGTPYYTAPEIWSGQAATPRSDLYALGATYFFMLTGRLPFEAKDLPTLIAAHLNNSIPQASSYDARIPIGCDRIIRKCLAKSPKDRYASASAVVEDAEELLRSLAIEPPGTRHKSSRPARPDVATPQLAAPNATNPYPSIGEGEPADRESAVAPEHDGTTTPLTLRQSFEYVCHCIGEIRSSNGMALMVTPDACLLVAFFAAGDPGKIRALLKTVVHDLDADQSSVVTSWDVWDANRGTCTEPPLAGRGVDETTQTTKWPSAQALAILNECRAQCGMPLRR